MSAPRAPVICLLGGESSGKTSLAQSLHSWLSKENGLQVTRVAEHLRHWCESHHRAPLAHEQAAIAREQSALIDAARASPDTQLVIADTSALTVATFSQQYFQDSTLLPSALAEQRGYTCTLLMGLDLPWVADGLFRDSPAVRAETDALLRGTLQTAGIAFESVYGQGAQRLHNSLRALTPVLTPLLGANFFPTRDQLTRGRPGWTCEACSDPDCEHRLFSDLIRAQPPSPHRP